MSFVLKGMGHTTLLGVRIVSPWWLRIIQRFGGLSNIEIRCAETRISVDELKIETVHTKQLQTGEGG